MAGQALDAVDSAKSAVSDAADKATTALDDAINKPSADVLSRRQAFLDNPDADANEPAFVF